MDRLSRRLRAPAGPLRARLYRGSFALLASEALSAVLGLGFWLLVSRLYTDRDAGIGSVLITSATLLASLSTLGLNLGLIRFLPEARGRRAAMVNASATVSAAIAAGLAAVYAFGSGLWSPVVGFLAQDLGAFVLFVAFVGTWSAYLVFDAALIGLGAAKFVLVRAVAYGALKLLLPLALIPPLTVPLGLFAAWGLGLLAANVLAAGWLFPRVVPEYVPRPVLEFRTLSPMLRFAVANHVATLFASLPGLVFPIVIAQTLAPENAVYFYVAWSTTGLLHLIPGSIFLSVFAEGSRAEGEMRRSTWHGLLLAFALLAPAVVATLLASESLVTLAFRPSYAQAVPALNILALAALPATVTFAYATVLRIRKRLRHLVAFYALTSLGTLALGYGLLLVWGLMGAAIGVAAVQVAAAAVSSRDLARDGSLGATLPRAPRT